MNQFIANTDAMNGWQLKLGDVSTDVGKLISGAPGTSTVTNTHGTIGFPMQAAFDAAQSARGNAMGATQAASAKIGDLLRQAAQAYERGDMAAAGRLKTQAEQLDGSGPASVAGGVQAPGAAQAGGASSAGQMMGQFGQIAGQMMQGITQPLAGMAQSVGQMPQQVSQGVQGIVQTATHGAAGAGGGAAEAAAETATKAAGSEGGEKAPVGVMTEDRMRELQGEGDPIQPMDTGDTRDKINPIDV